MATIAVIDDNRQIRDVVVRALSAAGYSVMDWGDPSAAVAYLASNRESISLVVMDGVMPQLTGPEAAARIRLTRPAVPILLMSGHEAPMFKEFFGKPGHHYIAKPFVIQDLVSRVAGIIGPATKRPV
jgi:two-component system, cell cycle sensor histidine kinase and response regulator CckA